MPRSPDPTLAARRRAQILEAAMVCFRRRGFHQATMQEICAEARVSPGALYRYFDSKADIIVAIAQDEHAGLEPMFAKLQTGARFSDCLLEIAQMAWLKFHIAEDASLIGDVLAEAARDRALAEHIMAADAALRQRLAEVVRVAQGRGEVMADLEPDQVARMVLALIDGIGLRLSIARQSDLTQASADFSMVIARAFAPAKTKPLAKPAAKSKPQPPAKPAAKSSLQPPAKPAAKSNPPSAPRRTSARVKETA